MYSQKENIDSLIQRLLLIFVFLLVLIAFKSSDSPKNNSNINTATIVNIIENNNSIILAESIAYPFSFNSSELYKFISFGSVESERLKTIFYNNRTNLLLRTALQKFLTTKPQIIQILSYQYFFTFYGEDLPLISS